MRGVVGGNDVDPVVEDCSPDGVPVSRGGIVLGDGVVVVSVAFFSQRSVVGDCVGRGRGDREQAVAPVCGRT